MDQAAALGGLVLDDDVAELAWIVQPRLDVDGVLELRVCRRRRHADLSGRDVLALLADGVDHVLRLQTEGIELLRVHPDPHGIRAGAEHLDAADARQARQHVGQVDRRVVAHEQAVVFAVRRIQRDDLQDRRVLLLHADALRLHRLGQRGECELHAVLHQHLVDIGVGADRERHRQAVGAVGGAGRLHVQHAVDAVDLLLDRQGDRIDDGLRAGAGIARRHRHCRRHHVGILRHRQTEQRYGADQDQDDRQHIGEDRMLDEEFRHHRRRALSADGRELRHHLRAGRRTPEFADHHAIIRVQPAGDDAQMRRSARPAAHSAAG